MRLAEQTTAPAAPIFRCDCGILVLPNPDRDAAQTEACKCTGCWLREAMARLNRRSA